MADTHLELVSCLRSSEQQHSEPRHVHHARRRVVLVGDVVLELGLAVFRAKDHLSRRIRRPSRNAASFSADFLIIA